MASDLQRRKIAPVFSAMDADSDGLLTESDFRALTDRWTALRGAEPGSDAHALLTAVMMGWWAALLAGAGPDGETVTLADVLAVAERLPSMRDAVVGTANAMFNAVDRDGDGEVSAAEYGEMIEGWTGTRGDSAEVFPLLDADGDGRLSRAEFADLWFEFWAGDDSGARGNLVFGRY
ncbi:EF-hand domain-containing protein [Allokutzneria albata]|uniref:Ca2+-binding protein, EF-hand superfamily n=1 Tax=Allokutzneria albata TaxID=211114 RepID=A0A1G9UBX5_ALLAB|nr:EF-hand domain-containing protein [Allokutzneria albata]SDM57214.1 Ca2+-binding protein, EF-hand superfamily [Allokutzneria albata]